MSRRRVYGVTKCMGCHEPFATADPIQVSPTLATRWRETSPGNFRGTDYLWSSKWHESCWEQQRREAERSVLTDAIRSIEIKIEMLEEIADHIEDRSQVADYLAQRWQELERANAALADFDARGAA